nr:prepilin-type N-terminal cleavage/methylation domain-containing protein [Alteromonas facilis]
MKRQLRYKYPNGFTLVEVLVATVIMVAALASLTLVFRTNLLSNQKAVDNLTIDTSVPIILNNVRQMVRRNSDPTVLNGRVFKVFSTEYSISLQLVQRASPPRFFNPDSQQLENFPRKYALWNIHVQVNNGDTSREFQLYELSWNDE